MTGGRLLRAKDFLDGKRFMLTYGDGVSDVNIPELIKCHEAAQKPVTLTATRPVGRFGVIGIGGEGAVESFNEKADGGNAWINGGFFVMEPEVFDYLADGDATVLERGPFEQMTADGKLNAYRHGGFWRAMDTLLDKNQLTEMWVNSSAPWALWEKG
jgi:glucose-1-phosphate cytidylyltransferase